MKKIKSKKYLILTGLLSAIPLSILTLSLAKTFKKDVKNSTLQDVINTANNDQILNTLNQGRFLTFDNQKNFKVNETHQNDHLTKYIYGELSPNTYGYSQYADQSVAQTNHLRSDTRSFIGSSNPLDGTGFSTHDIGNTNYFERIMSAIGITIDSNPANRMKKNESSFLFNQNSTIDFNFLLIIKSIIKNMINDFKDQNTRSDIMNVYYSFLNKDHNTFNSDQFSTINDTLIQEKKDFFKANLTHVNAVELDKIIAKTDNLHNVKNLLANIKGNTILDVPFNQKDIVALKLFLTSIPTSTTKNQILNIIDIYQNWSQLYNSLQQVYKNNSDLTNDVFKQWYQVSSNLPDKKTYSLSNQGYVFNAQLLNQLIHNMPQSITKDFKYFSNEQILSKISEFWSKVIDNGFSDTFNLNDYFYSIGIAGVMTNFANPLINILDNHQKVNKVWASLLFYQLLSFANGNNNIVKSNFIDDNWYTKASLQNFINTNKERWNSFSSGASELWNILLGGGIVNALNDSSKAQYLDLVFNNHKNKINGVYLFSDNAKFITDINFKPTNGFDATIGLVSSLNDMKNFLLINKDDSIDNPLQYLVKTKEPLILDYDLNKLFIGSSMLKILVTNKANIRRVQKPEWKLIYQKINDYIDEQLTIFNNPNLTKQSFITQNSQSFKILVTSIFNNEQVPPNLKWVLPTYDANTPQDVAEQVKKGYDTLFNLYQNDLSNSINFNNERFSELKSLFNTKYASSINIKDKIFKYNFDKILTDQDRLNYQLYVKLVQQDPKTLSVEDQQKLKHLTTLYQTQTDNVDLKTYFYKFFMNSIDSSIYGSDYDQFFNDNWSELEKVQNNHNINVNQLYNFIQKMYGIKHIELYLPDDYFGKYNEITNQISKIKLLKTTLLNDIKEQLNLKVNIDQNQVDLLNQYTNEINELVLKLNALDTTMNTFDDLDPLYVLKYSQQNIAFMALNDNIKNNLFLLNNNFLNQYNQSNQYLKELILMRLTKKSFFEQNPYDLATKWSQYYKNTTSFIGSSILNLFTLNFSGLKEDYEKLRTQSQNFELSQNAKGLTLTSFILFDNVFEKYMSINKYIKYASLANEVINIYNQSLTDQTALKNNEVFKNLIQQFSNQKIDINSLDEFQLSQLTNTLVDTVVQMIKSLMTSDPTFDMTNNDNHLFLQEFITKTLLLQKDFNDHLHSKQNDNSLISKTLDDYNQILTKPDDKNNILSPTSLNNLGKYGLLKPNDPNQTKNQEIIKLQINNTFHDLKYKIHLEDEDITKIRNQFNEYKNQIDKDQKLNLNQVNETFLKLVDQILNAKNSILKTDELLNKSLVNIISSLMLNLLDLYSSSHTLNNSLNQILNYLSVNNLPKDDKGYYNTSNIVYEQIKSQLNQDNFAQLFISDFSQKLKKNDQDINTQSSLHINSASNFLNQFVNYHLNVFNNLDSNKYQLAGTNPFVYMFNQVNEMTLLNSKWISNDYQDLIVKDETKDPHPKYSKLDIFKTQSKQVAKSIIDQFGTGVFTKVWLLYKFALQPVYSKIRHQSFMYTTYSILAKKDAKQVVRLLSKQGLTTDPKSLVELLKTGKINQLKDLEATLVKSPKRKLINRMFSRTRSWFGSQNIDQLLKRNSLNFSLMNENNKLQEFSKLNQQTIDANPITKNDIKANFNFTSKNFDDLHLASFASYNAETNKFNTKLFAEIKGSKGTITDWSHNKQFKGVWEQAEKFFTKGQADYLKAQSLLKESFASKQPLETLLNDTKFTSLFTNDGKTLFGIKSISKLQKTTKLASKLGTIFKSLFAITKSNVIGFVIGVVLDSLFNYLSFDQTQKAGYWTPIDPQSYDEIVPSKYMFVDNKSIVDYYNDKHLLNPIKINYTNVLSNEFAVNLVKNEQFLNTIINQLLPDDHSDITDKTGYKYALKQQLYNNAMNELLQTSPSKDYGSNQTLNTNNSATGTLFYSKQYQNMGSNVVNYDKTPQSGSNQLLNKSTLIDFNINYDDFISNPPTNYFDIKGFNAGIINNQSSIFSSNGQQVGAFGGYTRFPITDLLSGVSSLSYLTINDNNFFNQSNLDSLKHDLDSHNTYQSSYKLNISPSNLIYEQNDFEKANMRNASYYNWIPFVGRIIADSQRNGANAFKLSKEPTLTTTPFMDKQVAYKLLTTLNGNGFNNSRQNLLAYSSLTYQLVKLPNGNLGLKVSQNILDLNSGAYSFNDKQISPTFINSFNSVIMYANSYVPNDYTIKALNNITNELKDINNLILDPKKDLFKGSNNENVLDYQKLNNNSIPFLYQINNNGNFDNEFINSWIKQLNPMIKQGIAKTVYLKSSVNDQSLFENLDKMYQDKLQDFQIVRIQFIPVFDSLNNLIGLKGIIGVKFNQLNQIYDIPLNTPISDQFNIKTFNNDNKGVSLLKTIKIIPSIQAQTNELFTNILKVHDLSANGLSTNLLDLINKQNEPKQSDYDKLLKRYEKIIQNQYEEQINSNKLKVLQSFFYNDVYNLGRINQIISGDPQSYASKINEIYEPLLISDKLLLQSKMTSINDHVIPPQKQLKQYLYDTSTLTLKEKISDLCNKLGLIFYNNKIYENVQDWNLDLQKTTYNIDIPILDAFSFNLYTNEIFSFAQGGSVVFKDNFNGTSYNLNQKFDEKLHRSEWVFDSNLTKINPTLVFENLSYKHPIGKNPGYNLVINRNFINQNNQLQTQNFTINFIGDDYSTADLSFKKTTNDSISNIFKKQYLNLRELPFGKDLNNLDLNDIKLLSDRHKLNDLLSDNPDELALSWINKTQTGKSLNDSIQSYNNLKLLGDPSRYDKFIIKNPFKIFHTAYEKSNNIIHRLYELKSSNINSVMNELWYSNQNVTTINNNIPFSLVDVSYLFDSSNLLEFNMPSNAKLTWGKTKDGNMLDTINYVEPINNHVAIDFKNQSGLFKLCFEYPSVNPNQTIKFSKLIYISDKPISFLKNLVDPKQLLNDYLSNNNTNATYVSDFKQNDIYTNLVNFALDNSLNFSFDNILKTYRFYEQYQNGLRIYQRNQLAYQSANNEITNIIAKINDLLKDQPIMGLNEINNISSYKTMFNADIIAKQDNLNNLQKLLHNTNQTLVNLHNQNDLRLNQMKVLNDLIITLNDQLELISKNNSNKNVYQKVNDSLVDPYLDDKIIQDFKNNYHKFILKDLITKLIFNHPNDLIINQSLINEITKYINNPTLNPFDFNYDKINHDQGYSSLDLQHAQDLLNQQSLHNVNQEIYNSQILPYINSIKDTLNKIKTIKNDSNYQINQLLPNILVNTIDQDQLTSFIKNHHPELVDEQLTIEKINSHENIKDFTKQNYVYDNDHYVKFGNDDSKLNQNSIYYTIYYNKKDHKIKVYIPTINSDWKNHISFIYKNNELLPILDFTNQPTIKNLWTNISTTWFEIINHLLKINTINREIIIDHNNIDTQINTLSQFNQDIINKNINDYTYEHFISTNPNDLYKKQWNDFIKSLFFKANPNELSKKFDLSSSWLSIISSLQPYDLNNLVNNVLKIYNDKYNSLLHTNYDELINYHLNIQSKIQSQITKLNEQKQLKIKKWLDQVRLFTPGLENFNLVHYSNRYINDPKTDKNYIYTNNLVYLSDLIQSLEKQNKTNNLYYKISKYLYEIENIINLKLNKSSSNLLIKSNDDVNAMELYRKYLIENITNITPFDFMTKVLRLQNVNQNSELMDNNIIWNGNLASTNPTDKTFTFNILSYNKKTNKSNIIILKVPYNDLSKPNSITYKIIADINKIKAMYDFKTGMFNNTYTLDQKSTLYQELPLKTYMSLNNQSNYLLNLKQIDTKIDIKDPKIVKDNKYIKNNLLPALSSYYSILNLINFNKLFPHDIITNLDNKNLDQIYNQKFNISIQKMKENDNQIVYSFNLVNDNYQITFSDVFLKKENTTIDRNDLTLSINKNINGHWTPIKTNGLVHPLMLSDLDLSLFNKPINDDQNSINDKLTGVFNYDEQKYHSLIPLFKDQTEITYSKDDFLKLLADLNVDISTNLNDPLLQTLNILNDNTNKYKYSITLSHHLINYDSIIDSTNNLLILNWKIKINSTYHSPIVSHSFVSMFKLANTKYIINENINPLPPKPQPKIDDKNDQNKSNENNQSTPDKLTVPQVSDNLTQILNDKVNNIKDQLLLYSIFYANNQLSSDSFINNIKSTLKYFLISYEYINQDFESINSMYQQLNIDNVVNELYEQLSTIGLFNNLNVDDDQKQIQQKLTNTLVNHIFFRSIPQPDPKNNDQTAVIKVSSNNFFKYYLPIYTNNMNLRDFAFSLSFVDLNDNIKKEMLLKKNLFDKNHQSIINPFITTGLEFNDSKKYIGIKIDEKTKQISLVYTQEPQLLKLNDLLTPDEINFDRDITNQIISYRLLQLQSLIDHLIEFEQTQFEIVKQVDDADNPQPKYYKKISNKYTFNINASILYYDNPNKVSFPDDNWIPNKIINYELKDHNIEQFLPSKIISYSSTSFIAKNKPQSRLYDVKVIDHYVYFIYETSFATSPNIIPIKSFVMVDNKINPWVMDLINQIPTTKNYNISSYLNHDTPPNSIKALITQFNDQFKDYLIKYEAVDTHLVPTKIEDQTYTLSSTSSVLNDAYYTELNAKKVDSHFNTFWKKNSPWIIGIIIIATIGLGVIGYVIYKKKVTRTKF